MSPAGALLGLAAGGAGALALAGLLAEARRAPLTEADRRAAPGTLHALGAGRTHIRRWGPVAGPVALCIHGLSTPSPVWAPLAGRLAAAGWRVVAFDLYGRGLSDRPARIHDDRLYLGQIAQVMAAEGIDRADMLIGFSMGGSLAAAFAAAHPDRVARLVLLAPAGFTHGLRGLYTAARVPILGDAVWSLAAPAMLRRDAARDGTAHALPDLPAIIARETARRGYLPALLSALRHTVPKPRRAAHRRLAERGLPVLAIWGAEDDVIPVAAMGRLADANPAAHQIVLEDAGHGLPYTHPGAVADHLLNWAETAPSPGGPTADRPA